MSYLISKYSGKSNNECAFSTKYNPNNRTTLHSVVVYYSFV
jgi:hypothetical protein